jgi:hypothetical protein
MAVMQSQLPLAWKMLIYVLCLNGWIRFIDEKHAPTLFYAQS